MTLHRNSQSLSCTGCIASFLVAYIFVVTRCIPSVMNHPWSGMFTILNGVPVSSWFIIGLLDCEFKLRVSSAEFGVFDAACGSVAADLDFFGCSHL